MPSTGKLLVLALMLLAAAAGAAAPAGAAGWAIGLNGTILKSTDAGGTWTLSNPTTATLNGLSFADDNTGWVVGSGGTILKTTNGGTSFTVSTPTTAILNAVQFVGTSNGWAVGTSGTILRTVNGGTSWTSMNPTTQTLNSVFFLDGTTGWTVGTNGNIFKTTNSGTSWTGTFPTTATLNDVFFVSSTTGWAVGSAGTILKTTNGGTSWTLSNPVAANLNSVHFVDANTGFVVGAAGTILKTVNAGSTWTAMNPVGAELRSVHFVNATTGWAVGLGGTVLKTTNAGGAWASSFPTGVQLNGVQFVSIPVNISVTVQTSPTGRSFSVDGTTYITTQVFSWVAGSSHTIATTTPQAGGAGTQYVFASWSDGGAISHTVAPTVATTYTANFTTQYMLTMNAGAGGTVSPASGFRSAGSMVSISASPSAGFAFSGWTGSGSGSYTGSNNPANVTMNGPITETGSFVALVSVTVRAQPLGRSFSVDGTTFTAPQTFQWVPGSSHTIATTTPQAGATGTRYIWMSWSDGGAMSHSVAPTASVTYTALFETQYFLTMTAGPNGAVTPPSGWHVEGSNVTITATADAGYTFGGWTGSGTGSYTGAGNPAMVTMAGPISETASFTTNAVGVTVQTFPDGLGITVDGTAYTSPHGFMWPSGSTHTIETASPQPAGAGTRYVWSHWSDGGAISHTVAPTASVVYTASFDTEHFLTMTAGAHGSVQPASGWFGAGAVVAISATSDPAYGFGSWAGTGPGSYSGPDSMASVTMNGPIEEIASFRGPVAVDDPPPSVLAFAAPRPNPFRGALTLTFELPEARAVSLVVVDVGGRRIAELANGLLPAGRHARSWRARDGSIAAGIYFAVLDAGGTRLTRRIVALR